MTFEIIWDLNVDKEGTWEDLGDRSFQEERNELPSLGLPFSTFSSSFLTTEFKYR